MYISFEPGNPNCDLNPPNTPMSIKFYPATDLDRGWAWWMPTETERRERYEKYRISRQVPPPRPRWR